MPFRDAHAVVGSLVRQSLEPGAGSLDVLVRAHPDLGDEAAALLGPGRSVQRRTTRGGGGPVPVREQRERFRAHLVAGARPARLMPGAGPEPLQSRPMAGIGVTPTTARQRLVLVTAALVAVVALVMIAQLNGLLAGSRVDGGVAGSVSDLSVSLLPAELPDEAEILSVVGSWKAYDTEVVQARPELGYSSPVATANAVLRLDAFLLIPVYAIFALTLLLWARSWPPPPAGQPVPRAIVALGRWWFLFVVLAIGLVADELENVVQSRIIDQAWDGRPLDGVTWVVVTGLVKWIALGLVLAPFAVVAVRVAVPVVRPLLRTSWFALALLALLGVLVSTDQAADVVRRWGLGQTLWSVLCVALLAASIGLAGSRAFQIGRTPVTVRAHGKPLSIRTLGRAAVALLPLAAVALAFLLAGGALDWRGLSLFAVVLLAAYLLSLPIRHFWEGEQTVDVPTVQTAPAPLRQKFGAVLAAVVPFLVGHRRRATEHRRRVRHRRRLVVRPGHGRAHPGRRCSPSSGASPRRPASAR